MSTSLYNKQTQSILRKFGKILRRGFSLTEVLIALAVVAVIAVLIIPVITTRAQNRSFAVGYETEIKQMMNSLEGLPVNENKGDITKTMMYSQEDTGEYSNTSGIYINKYMKVSKYCGDEPGECFGNEYYKYENNDRVTFDINTIKGACALLKNGVSVCLKPQIKQENNKKEYIEGWIDLTGPKGPNIYGRDLRAFKINLYQHMVFPEDKIGDIIITEAPAPCEGGECPDDRDPCDLLPLDEACCTKEDYKVSGETDLCCFWITKNPNNPNYSLCDIGPKPCDPTKEDCDIKACQNHTITGPEDKCCSILEKAGTPDPNCCKLDSTSDYCCGLNPNTEACCEKKIKDKGESALNANDACCNIKSIYNKHTFCQSACEKDNDSQECCETIARRNVVTTPDDLCCNYDTVNGLDKSGKSVNNRNSYCCRLPENGGEQCCEWKYKNIGTNKDFYAKHDFNKDGGTFDACCHHADYGIKSNKNEVLSRCCTVNTPQTDAKEDELCCDYLVKQLGQNKLVHGQALRRCCAYGKWKNMPQCCSNVSDGMVYSSTVDWSSKCCMPNSIYNNDVTPNKDCCFAMPNANGESNDFWKGKRYSGCCSYGSLTYNGKTINTIGQWQLNCCYLGRNSYPTGASGTKAYNENCCGTQTNKRTQWNNNECCETLLNENNTNTGLSQWQNNCCYGYKGGSQTTNKDYYKTEPACCNLTGNWNSDCCSISSLKGSDKWNKNCCNSPTLYSNSVYRANCCAASTSDYTRKDHGIDNPNGLNAANKDLTKHREYCCHPDAPNPANECCSFYHRADDNWTDRDGNPIGEAYKVACCKKGDAYCPDSCAIRSKTGNSGVYDFTRCCADTTVYSRLSSDNTLLTSWKKDCCNFASVKGTSYYEDYCCKDNNVGQATDGTTTWNDAANCCTYTSTSKPSKNCCDLANTNNFNNKYGGETFRSKCCELDSKYCNCSSTTDKKLSHWINKCCISSNPGGLNRDDFSGACCSSPDGGTKVSGNLHEYCCDYNNDATDFCCEAARNAGWKNDDFHKKCCKFGSEYCSDDCSLMYEENHSEFEKNKTKCCKETTSYKDKEYWQKQCCSDNLGNLATGNSNKDYSKYCCNDGNGTMKHSLGNSAYCCYDISVASDVCCNAKGESNWLGTKCCSAQGKNWKDINSGYCCDYSKDANTACCEVAKDAGWENGDFHKKCCEFDSEYCSDDCSLMYEENHSEFEKNKTKCCKETTSYKDQEYWQKQCCSDNLGNLATGNSNKDYSKYCCNDGNGAMKHSLGNSAYCCYDMSVASDVCCNAKGESNWLGTKCCSAQGKNWKDINSGYCCDYSKDANTACCEAAKDAGWKNDDFHKKCCEFDSEYCSDCTMLYEENQSEFEKNKSTCCKETTSYKDQEYWQKQCCSGNLGNLATGDSSKDYSKYCCNSGNGAMKHSLGDSAYCCYDMSVASDVCCNAKGESNWLGTKCCKSQGTAWNNQESSYCCDYSKDANTACCKAAEKANWPNKDFQKKCCESDNEYCSDCTMLYEENLEEFKNKKDSCCESTASSKKGQEDWQKICCSGNLGGLGTGGSNSDYSKYCCSDGNGSMKHSLGNSGACCYDMSTASSTCCDAIGKSNWSGTKCCSENGKDYNGSNENNCCSWSELSATGDSAPDNCCSSATNTTQYSSNWKDGCCNKSSYRTASKDCCQWRYDNGKWDRDKNAYTSDTSEDCCTSENRITGSDWVSGCCSEKYYASGKGTDEGKECCRKLYTTDAKAQVFSAAEAGCCDILGVNSKTGKDSSGNYYPECQLTCFKESIYKTDSKYSPSDDAKDCCADGGKGLVETSDNWKKYCCGMTDSEHSWSFPTTSGNKTCCDKRKVSGTGVYAYDPYYMDHACPAGGEKNKCAAYGYASFGFVCPSEDKCSAWKSFPNDVSLSDSEKSSCCSGWGDNLPEDLKDACCAVKSDLSYCDPCPNINPESATLECCNSWQASGKLTGQYASTVIKCCNDHSSFLSSNTGTCCNYLGPTSLTCCNHFKDNDKTSMQTACCKLSDFKSQNSSSGQWCAPNTSCTLAIGTHISINCERVSSTNSYGSNTSATNSSTIKCSVVGGDVTVSFAFKKTNGQGYGGAVNSGDSKTFSDIKSITSVSISPHGTHYFSESYSPSLISDYNEYNAEVTVLNNNNESCSYSKYENNCKKFKGPKYCDSPPTPSKPYVKVSCSSTSCYWTSGGTAQSEADANLVSSSSASAVVACCYGWNGDDSCYATTSPVKINLGQGSLSSSSICPGRWIINSCTISGSGESKTTTNSGYSESNYSSCSATLSK